jgi:hypothetical protein
MKTYHYRGAFKGLTDIHFLDLQLIDYNKTKFRKALFRKKAHVGIFVGPIGVSR